MKFSNSELEKKKKHSVCASMAYDYNVRCFLYQLFNLQRVNSVCMCVPVFLLDMVVHTYNPSTQEAKVQRLL